MSRRFHMLPTLSLAVMIAMISALSSAGDRPACAAGAPSSVNDVPKSLQPQSPANDGMDAHQSVITPPATGDSGINKGAPSSQDFPTPVIHPAPPLTTPSPDFRKK